MAQIDYLGIFTNSVSNTNNNDKNIDFYLNLHSLNTAVKETSILINNFILTLRDIISFFLKTFFKEFPTLGIGLQI